MGLLFYILGIITGSSILLLIIYKFRLDKSEKLNTHLIKENSNLAEFKRSKISRKRIAKYDWDGWHLSEDTSGKNQWCVTFELREVSKSIDNDEYQFEVLNVYPSRETDGWDTKRYTDYFNKITGGGWLDVKKTSGFEWVIRETAGEIRDNKLDELLGNGDN